MKYIDQINFFWSLDAQQLFSPNVTRFYFFLLDYANSKYWNLPLIISDIELGHGIGMSVNTVKSCRKILINAGLIKHKGGEHGRGLTGYYELIQAQKMANKLSIADSLNGNKLSNNDSLNGNKLSIADSLNVPEIENKLSTVDSLNGNKLSNNDSLNGKKVSTIDSFMTNHTLYSLNKTEREREKKSPPENFKIEKIEKSKIVDIPESLTWNVEKHLQENQKIFEAACMEFHAEKNFAMFVLKKYHLHMEEKNLYPIQKNCATSGFKKWLMTEKKPLSPVADQTQYIRKPSAAFKKIN